MVPREPESKREWSPERILETAGSFWKSSVILAAAELDLFPRLAERAATAGELASESGTDPRATARLLDALAAMEILLKENGRYRLSPGVEPALAGDSPLTVAPMLKHLARLLPLWAELPAVVRTGKPARREGHRRDPEDTKAFIGGMHVMGRRLAREVAARIETKEAKRLLDVGGASGTYTIEFLRKEPEMAATLFDLPEVVELARERIQEEGLLGRVRLVSGDFCEDPLPEGHDLVLLSAIIHQNSREQNRELFAKCLRATEPGGRIVIRDHVMDASRTRPVTGALFAINMLVGTPGGGTYTFDEIQEDLETAGFRRARLLEADERMTGLVEAVKPDNR